MSTYHWVNTVPVEHSVLYVKVLVDAFNQDKALVVVGAFSVIVKTDCGTD